MQRRVPFLSGETYHIFNRGAHKQPVFLDEGDLRRFQVMLLLANSRAPVDAGNTLTKYQGRSLIKVYEMENPAERFVDILAYALMPNHFHLALRPRTDDGVSIFMRKLCTGYSMYFNRKHEHSGTLFQGRFKSSHVDMEPYFLWIFSYIHLNPLSIIAPEWEERRIDNVPKAQHFLSEYAYSSYRDYYMELRPEGAILNRETAQELIETKSDVVELLASYGRGNKLYEI